MKSYSICRSRIIALTLVFVALVRLMQAQSVAEDENVRPQGPEKTAASDQTPQLRESSVLAAGKGFEGLTDQPPTRGAGPGQDAKAIARWDVVPYQTVEKTLNLGVVAFHIKGIEKVSFSANGAPWIDVTSMTLNPETNVVEYWVTLRASDFPDGQVEVRAIAYPTVGIPRVLAGEIPFTSGNNTAIRNGEHSMWLYANGKKSLVRPEIFVRPSSGSDSNSGTAESPVATLSKALSLTAAKDGARIFLMEAGDYNPDREKEPAVKNNRWVTVEPGSGLTREQVSIVGAGDSDRLVPKIARLEWKNLKFRPDTYAYINESSATNGSSQWYENCLITTPELSAEDVPQWRSNVYATNSRVERYTYGFIGAQLVRNCAVKDTFDAYQCSQLVINSTVERMRASEYAAKHHPDLFQTWGEMKNIIVYGMTGDEIDGTQVIFMNQPLVAGPDMTDAALVDWNVKTYDPKGGPAFSQLQGKMNHILFKNVKIPNQKFIFRAETKGLNRFAGKNIEFQNCAFYNTFTSQQVPPGVTFRRVVGTAVQPRSKGYRSSAPEPIPDLQKVPKASKGVKP